MKKKFETPELVQFKLKITENIATSPGDTDLTYGSIQFFRSQETNDCIKIYSGAMGLDGSIRPEAYDGGPNAFMIKLATTPGGATCFNIIM